jgi:energy-coupling factor transporter ATP-binding protein EcfA2
VADKKATTIEEVWNSFEPSEVLEPDSPFRIERDSTDLRRPHRALMRAGEMRADNCEKWFLIGHRGCGKSTYLRWLLSIDEVKWKFHPVLYGILGVVDGNDLAGEDLLFSMASQLVDEGLKYDAIKPALKKELENWGRTLVETVAKAESSSVDVEGGLSAFFAKFLAKLQVQRSTRTEFRKEVEPHQSIKYRARAEARETLTDCHR